MDFKERLSYLLHALMNLSVHGPCQKHTSPQIATSAAKMSMFVDSTPVAARLESISQCCYATG